MRIERFEILDPLADANRIDRQTEALGDGDQNAAARCAVELGDHKIGDAGDLLECLHLIDGILSGRGVEHEQHCVRRVLVVLLQDAHDLGQLGHEVALVLQTPGRVDEQHVDAFRLRALQRLVADARRV